MRDKITDVVAFAGITAPWWTVPLDTLNQILTTLSLLFGICWIAYQFYVKIKGPK
jgi:hypothetical protein